MNKKFTSMMSVLMVAASLAACGRAAAGEGAENGNNAAGEHAPDGEAEARTGASVTEDANAFVENFGPKGWWIGAATRDLELDRDFVVEGDFWDKNDEANDHKRKIALYTQDDNHNVLERFTLTAPRLVIKSPNTVVSKGIVRGDIYVEAKGFSLDDATVEGNIIFASQEFKDSANLDDGHVNGDVKVEEA
ncbi:MAG: hypothetical protein FWF59_08030 [Turicibacter sp.]|nr:hypothetical protein [Turicibacter sp.]